MDADIDQSVYIVFKVSLDLIIACLLPKLCEYKLDLDDLSVLINMLPVKIY